MTPKSLINSFFCKFYLKIMLSVNETLIFYAMSLEMLNEEEFNNKKNVYHF